VPPTLPKAVLRSTKRGSPGSNTGTQGEGFSIYVSAGTSPVGQARIVALVAKLALRQYVYFCTSKASKLSSCRLKTRVLCTEVAQLLLRQYLYFCTSKASNLSTSWRYSWRLWRRLLWPLCHHSRRYWYSSCCCLGKERKKREGQAERHRGGPHPTSVRRE
jgi:hypothetical protein